MLCIFMLYIFMLRIYITLYLNLQSRISCAPNIRNASVHELDLFSTNAEVHEMIAQRAKTSLESEVQASRLAILGSITFLPCLLAANLRFFACVAILARNAGQQVNANGAS